MEKRETKQNKKEEELTKIIIIAKDVDQVILSPNKNTLLLNFKKSMKWLIISLLRFQYSLYLVQSNKI